MKMTGQPGETTPSTFNARADNAALALRNRLQGEGRQVPSEAPVEVDANGRPPASPPPEGSYARQSLEAQRQAQEARQQPVEEQPVQRPDPNAQTPQEDNAQSSPRAEQRIKELVGQLRQREQDLQQAIENGKKATETANQFAQRLQSLEQQHQQMLESNLENLDPDTRMQVLQDARMSEMFDKFESRIMGRIQPQLQQIETQTSHQEKQALSGTYPAFDIEVHGPLIDMFRENNPRCSIEQAFRAIADPSELQMKSAASAQVVPPIVPPGNGDLAAARFAPPRERPQEAPPEDELVEESRRIAELRRSTDPAEQKEGMRMLDSHLRKRLGG